MLLYGSAAREHHLPESPASKDGKPAEGGPSTATGGAAQAPAGAPAAAAPKEKPAYVRPPPNQKSYMPLFMAPEAYGKKKDPAYELARKAAVEQVAKNAAKKERERLRRKRGAKKKEDVVLTVEESSRAPCSRAIYVRVG